MFLIVLFCFWITMCLQAMEKFPLELHKKIVEELAISVLFLDIRENKEFEKIKKLSEYGSIDSSEYKDEKKRKALNEFRYKCFDVLSNGPYLVAFSKAVYTMRSLSKTFYNSCNQLLDKNNILQLEDGVLEREYDSVIASIFAMRIPGVFATESMSHTAHFRAYASKMWKAIPYFTKASYENRFAFTSLLCESAVICNEHNVPHFMLYMRFYNMSFPKEQCAQKGICKEDFTFKKNEHLFFNFAFFSKVLQRMSEASLEAHPLLEQEGDICNIIFALFASYFKSKKQIDFPCAYKERCEGVYVHRVQTEHSAAFIAEEENNIAVTLVWKDIRKCVRVLRLIQIMYRNSMYEIYNEIGFLKKLLIKHS